jgi:hypothetical protein
LLEALRQQNAVLSTTFASTAICEAPLATEPTRKHEELGAISKTNKLSIGSKNTNQTNKHIRTE